VNLNNGIFKFQDLVTWMMKRMLNQIETANFPSDELDRESLETQDELVR
jgi:hypothetical protein